MKTLVVGATGGSGRAVVSELLARGHEVTAFSRTAHALPDAPSVRRVDGDATDPAAVEAVVAGHDAVVVTLGISEPAMRVRVRGPRGTPLDVRSRGTSTVVEAMARHGVRRLVVQSTYGVGETRDRLPLLERLFLTYVVGPQVADHERQETVVRTSGLDWVLVQPVTLHDRDNDEPAVSITGAVGRWRVSRGSVARILADAVDGSAYVGRSVAVSGRTQP